MKKTRKREVQRRFEEGFHEDNDHLYGDYWKALGRFVHTLAQTEYRLMRLLRKHARTSDIISGILFSGTRVKEAKELLCSILEEKKLTTLKEWLDRPLGHLLAVNTVRNNLVHWGARNEGAMMLVSNAHLTPPKKKKKQFRIGLTALDEMCKDLLRIDFMLTLALDDEEPDTGAAKKPPKPWLYKPPQPSAPKTHHRRRPTQGRR